MDEEGGIGDGRIGENWAVVMDAMQESGTLGHFVIKGLLFIQHKHSHRYNAPVFSCLSSDRSIKINFLEEDCAKSVALKRETSLRVRLYSQCTV